VCVCVCVCVILFSFLFGISSEICGGISKIIVFGRMPHMIVLLLTSEARVGESLFYEKEDEKRGEGIWCSLWL
jgi:hypothetical protein